MQDTLQRIRQFQEDWQQTATADAQSRAPPLSEDPPVTITVTATADEQPPSTKEDPSTATSTADPPPPDPREDALQTETGEGLWRRPTPPQTAEQDG